MTPEDAALDALLDWRNSRMPELIELRERRREKLKQVLNAVETLWTETAPTSDAFTIEKGLELLLYELRRYQAAVARVFEKERDHEALLKHKAAAGQEVAPAQQRWFACRDVTDAVRQALDTASASSETGKEDP